MAGNAQEFCVPLATLSMPGEGDQMTPPEVGDVVTASVEGKVTKIDGDNAYVKPTSINGKPIDEPEAPGTPEEADASDLASLQDAAKQQGSLS